MTAHKGWTTYANVRLLITCDSLEKAKRYEEKYVNTGCPTTDLSSEDEAGERGKRRVRPNPVYMESDGESETSCVKRRFAKPPDVHCPTVLPESSQYPSVPTPNASSAFGGSHSEDVLSIHQADNGFCGSYLAELDQSMDHCNDDGGASNAHGSRLADFSSPGLAHLTPQHPSHPPSAPETPRGRLYGGESSRVLKDIAAMRTTKMLTELCMEVKQISRDINFIKTELAKLNIHGAGPESQEDNFPIMLPLTNEEKFDETEAALREEAARRKMQRALSLMGSWSVLSSPVSGSRGEASHEQMASLQCGAADFQPSTAARTVER
ncbi:Phosphatidylinositol 45-bisphosphate 3-kinase catalytic subunit beta isoform [Dissostichus eleginoides]|uniref:Phosphatidylinositol 45-bisphosphate 3-kinase catalytic subunit beta isoform n=1 Tax=Dissostichus eleginoides TaxID=100907 RepID=A0AAD9C519_DISEL|nr:Phosphatidylinositol 45-bisphosphate 3-kinase catalytic subunit beta isoform [Dissostichus eleginoides]